MYRLVLYVLIILVCIADILGYFSLLPYTPVEISLTTIFLVCVGWIANMVFSWAYDAPTNFESVYITSLILALILAPAQSLGNVPNLVWAVILAMLSKYVFAINKKHIFNPAAIAVVITSFTLGESASWWVGTAWMAPFVAIAGFLIIRKLRFFDLAWGFFMTNLVISIGFGLFYGDSILMALSKVVFDSSMLFLGSIMVTEPLTMPPTNRLQMIYGALVGLLAVPEIAFAGFSLTPEMALCIGNIFAYIVSPKIRLLLTLSEKIDSAKGTADFVFKLHRKIEYQPGQYMEWTMPHSSIDSRGNRRYFTLASSPTEDTIRVGVKLSFPSSSYKKALFALDKHTPIVASQLAGDFTLPKNSKQKLVFLAGGIGITPFRSMIKYLIDTKQHRDIVLCYANKGIEEIAYQDVFGQAEKQFGLKVIYTLTDKNKIPSGWKGKVGRIDDTLLRKEIPDFAERFFYLSGPPMMVNAYEKALKDIGVPNRQIRKDFFPGLA